MVILIIYFVGSILFSFLCSIWEAVLLSITPTYITAKVNEGSKLGGILKEYKKDIDKPLSAILTLNTIAHTLGAIGVGAQAGNVFGNNIINLFGLSISYESIIAALMTLCILLLSEIIPKTLGANNWKALTPFTVQSLRVLMFVLTPFVWISQILTRFLKKNKSESVLSRSDFAALANEGHAAGSLAKNEHSIIQNLLQLEDLTVNDIMTPRTVMFKAFASETVQEFYSKNTALRFSRIPLFDKNADDIIGFALKDEILEEIVKGNTTTKLGDIKRKITSIDDDTNLYDFLNKLTKEKEHIALVNDKYGSIVGVVTMEDLFETLLGIEITDESDNIADLQKYARQKWEERAKKNGLIE